MNLQSIVTSLELSRKLVKVGFERERGIAYWFFPADFVQKQTWGLVPEYATGQEGEYYQAFTFNELWSLLPNQIFIMAKEKLYCLRLYPRFVGYYPLDKSKALWDIDIQNTTIQEATGELLLWVKANGYLND